MKEEKTEDPTSEFDPLGHLSGFATARTHIEILTVLKDNLDQFSKDHFTWKRISIVDLGNLDKITYEVYFDGELFSTYAVPFEKMLVLIVEALETGYRLGGKTIMNLVIDSMKTPEK